MMMEPLLLSLAGAALLVALFLLAKWGVVSWTRDIFDKAKEWYQNLGNLGVWLAGAFIVLVAITSLLIPYTMGAFIPENQKTVEQSGPWQQFLGYLSEFGQKWDETWAKIPIIGSGSSGGGGSGGGSSDGSGGSEDGSNGTQPTAAPQPTLAPQPTPTRRPGEQWQVCEKVLVKYPVPTWGKWVNEQGLGTANSNEKALKLSHIPTGVICESFTDDMGPKRAAEVFELDCKSLDGEYGVTKLYVNGFAAQNIGTHTADVVVTVKGMGVWPDDCYEQKCQTFTEPTRAPEPTPTMYAVTPHPPSSTTTSPEVGKMYVVGGTKNVACLNIRTRPDTSKKNILACVPRGAVLTIRDLNESDGGLTMTGQGTWRPVIGKDRDGKEHSGWANLSPKYARLQ